MRFAAPHLVRALLAGALLHVPAAAQRLPGSGRWRGWYPRDSRVAHYSSRDPAERNDDFRRLAPAACKDVTTG